jgi:hypothetical protein
VIKIINYIQFPLAASLYGPGAQSIPGSGVIATLNGYTDPASEFDKTGKHQKSCQRSGICNTKHGMGRSFKGANVAANQIKGLDVSSVFAKANTGFEKAKGA